MCIGVDNLQIKRDLAGFLASVLLYFWQFLLSSAIMVYYFTSNVTSPPHTLYMGFDKHENEELIRWGWPEDVWFHVDKLSSAHVYLRLNSGETLDDVPQKLIEDCAQLVKANSIQGSKQNNVGVVYTMWDNLKKTGSMDVGQVGFHKDKEVRSIMVEKKVNEIVNRLNKTKREETSVDFRVQREERDRKERATERQKQQQAKQLKKEEDARKTAEKAAADELRSYSSLMSSSNMTSNQDVDYDSDDFM